MVKTTVRWWKIKSGNKNFSHDPVGHGSSKFQPGRSGDQIFKVATNNCVPAVWTVLHDTLLVARILR